MIEDELAISIMENAIDDMNNSIVKIRDISPIKHYNELCTAYTKFVDAFNNLTKEK